jgi:circadian clock protein KaiB
MLKYNRPIKLKDYHKNELFMFRLFISGESIISQKAISNLKIFLNKYLKNNYKFEIIDVYKHPEFTIAEEIITMPLLIKDAPLPKIRITGDLSDEKKLARELMIK